MTAMPTPAIGELARVNPTETSYMRHRRRVSPDRTPPAPDAPSRIGAWTPLSAISPWLVAAMVKSEDPRFFVHHGLDFQAIGRKALAIARRRIAPAGASTITQQLARNLYLTPERRLSRKLRELTIALRLEATLSKARILELYLNVIEWGDETWGCGAACERYFAAPPSTLDLFDATFLASLVAAPRAPLTGRNALRARYVQLRIVHQLLLSGFVSPAQCLTAVRQTRLLHGALDAGRPLPSALAEARAADADGGSASLSPADADVGGESAVRLASLLDRIPVRRLAIADAVATRCGAQEERAAWRHLRRRFGQDALIGAIVSGDYARLR